MAKSSPEILSRDWGGGTTVRGAFRKKTNLSCAKQSIHESRHLSRPTFLSEVSSCRGKTKAHRESLLHCLGGNIAHYLRRAFCSVALCASKLLPQEDLLSRAAVEASL